VNPFGYWHRILVFSFSYAELHLQIAVVWEVLSFVLIDANVPTLVMETARSSEILSSKLHGVMSQKPVILILTAVGT